MYYAHQTLFDNQTNKICALVPSKNNCSHWAWDVKAVVYEDGSKLSLKDKSVPSPYWQRFVPIFNEKGQALEGSDRSQNKFVDVNLKKYLKNLQTT